MIGQLCIMLRIAVRYGHNLNCPFYYYSRFQNDKISWIWKNYHFGTRLKLHFFYTAQNDYSRLNYKYYTKKVLA